MADRRRRGRGLRRLAASAALLVALTACTGDDDPADAATTSTLPPARTLLRVGVDEWPDCLNPLTCDADGVLGEQILRHVLPVAMEVTPDGTYAPSALLAGAPELDGGDAGQPFIVTYPINSAARWNDGRPVTSTDFRATWLAVMATPGADQAGYREIVSVDDTDPAVAVVELSAPVADWQELFGGSTSWLLQGDALGTDLDLTDRFRDELPFSAGPYRIAAWDRDVAVLAADETFWEAAMVPEIDQVRIERRGEDGSFASFDIVVPSRRVAPDEPEGFEAVDVSTTEVIGIWFDRRSPLLQVKAHRDALAVAFDRSELAAIVGADDEESLVTCLGWLPDVGPWCDASDLPEGLFEPDLGRFALAVEGWTAGDDGILARNGEPFALTVTHDPALPGAPAIASELADRFRDLGLAVSVGEISDETWRSDRDADAVGVGVFSFELGVSPLVDDLYGCPRGLPSSVIGWCPDELTTRVRAMAEQIDTAELLTFANEIGDVAAGDLAWIPLARRQRVMLVRTQLVAVPSDRAPGSGPLGRLHDFALIDR